jgi:glutaredoxin
MTYRSSVQSLICTWQFYFRWVMPRVASILTITAAVGLMAIGTGCASVDGDAVSSASSASGQPSPEEQLAVHLTQTGAVMYATYWCPYCQRQEALFGETAFQYIERVECDPQGENPQPDRCREAGVRGLPTWIINGQNYPGLRSLEELAELSGYANYEPSEQVSRPE